nr:YmfL family putative regulatory protein [Klebsiella pneumoniae]
MAGALGMTVTQFNNNLYEKNGCRFFEVSELEAMEDISNTSLLADYFARRRGALLVDVPHLEELDRVDLFSRAMRTSAARGQVDQIIEQALEDGVIERHRRATFETSRTVASSLMIAACAGGIVLAISYACLIS